MASVVPELAYSAPPHPLLHSRTGIYPASTTHQSLLGRTLTLGAGYVAQSLDDGGDTYLVAPERL
jgi:hypothetical protein